MIADKFVDLDGYVGVLIVQKCEDEKVNNDVIGIASDAGSRWSWRNAPQRSAADIVLPPPRVCGEALAAASRIRRSGIGMVANAATLFLPHLDGVW